MIDVCIPFRSDDPQRIKNKDFVVDYYKRFGNVIVADDGEKGIPNRSKMQNRTLERAKGDIFVSVDADVYVPEKLFNWALKKLETVPFIVIGDMIYLNEVQTDYFIEKQSAPEGQINLSHAFRNIPDATFIMARRKDLEGFQWHEDFRGWGSQGVVAVWELTQKLGKPIFLYDRVYHLYHKFDPYDKNRELAHLNMDLALKYNPSGNFERLVEHPEVSVCIPYRPSGDFRNRIADFVIGWWHTNRPGNWEVIIGTDDGKGMLNRGKMRNDAAKKAKGDILLFCDADCIVPPQDFDWIVKGAHSHSLVAYRSYVKLNEQDTQDLINNAPLGKHYYQLPKTGYKYWNRGPVMAVERKKFDAVYGWAELEGWGEEDPIMWCKLQKLLE